MSSFPGGKPQGTGHPPPASGRPIEGRDVALTIAVALGAHIAALIVGALIFQGSGPDSGSSLRVRIVIMLAASFFILFGSVYWVMIVKKGYAWADIGVRPLDPQWRRVSTMLGIAMIPAAMIISTLIQRQTGAEPQELMRAIGAGGFNLVSAITLSLYIALLQPIAEELLFRGVLFGWLRRTQGFAIANLVCAAAFAIAHVQFVAIVVTFFVGLALGWLRERSGTVLAPILMHQVFNGLTMILTFGAIGLTR